ncbi:ABC transporter ATP-binding protein [Rhodococcus sp. 1163]|uniref:ABC transporter ATP-binding protein n=1 Tax=unclassified Rhodococcus (in: high G+C Gram-positive bacteria) TaxID=192944 RepID=UPI000A023A5A|nr:ATP-binding cassette domain-containing protein [Rhodococcus sp. 1163]ORI19016.1 ABC transporter ATP-binding protein [Rhodococcus sp. 1163]
MISAQQVSVQYGKALAVREASLTAQPGHVTAVVGPNGAGKSSLLTALFGSVASSGTVTMDGDVISGKLPRQRMRAGLAYVPQGRQLFPRLTVRENLEIGARLLGVSNDVIETAYNRFPILRTRAKALAGVLSGGEQQMLVLSRALLQTPSVLLLDEMTTGLAPKIAGELLDQVRQLADTGITVVVAEPALHRVARIVDSGYVMMRGSLSELEPSAAALDSAYREAMGILEEAL